VSAGVWIPRLLPGTPDPAFTGDGGFRAGAYDGMPEDAYHADPVPGGSLSASGAKLLLPPSCPALYRYRRDHPKVSAEFDYGTAAHKFVLGTGPEITIIDAPDWRTKDAQQARKDARARGAVPLLTGEFSEIAEMARTIEQHPVAGQLFRPGGGVAEQSLFWQDPDHGIWRRARLDWQLPGLRLIVADYKSTTDASPAAIRKHVANFGYHMQAAWYTDAVQALGLGDDPAFIFVFQEKTPPYLITIAELDDDATRAGRDRNRHACEIWRDCTEAGLWPGYTDDIELISLPPWAARPEGDFLT
jgi:hypothetical protein